MSMDKKITADEAFFKLLNSGYEVILLQTLTDKELVELWITTQTKQALKEKVEVVPKKNYFDRYYQKLEKAKLESAEKKKAEQERKYQKNLQRSKERNRLKKLEKEKAARKRFEKLKDDDRVLVRVSTKYPSEY